jgi:hypothetical protein
MGVWQSVLRAAASSWVLAACADRAVIAALCPPGCTPLAHDSVCDCSGAAKGPGACDGGGCAAGADAAVSCSGAGCVDAGARAAQCEPGTFILSRKGSELLVVADDDATLGFWWPQLMQGFLDFLQEPASAGMAIGLQRFGVACESAAYEPPLVPIEPLPGNTAALQQAFPLAAGATNSTIPTMVGTLAYAQRWASEHPGSRPAVLFITDASPGACDGPAATGGYPAEPARIAGAAYSGSPSIKTYWLGGGGLGLIDEIASAGGTKAYTIAPLDGSAEVLAALHAIRADARGCELAWPDDRTLAPDSRVVARMPGGLSLSFDIERGASGCERDVFYVVDETAHALIACPRACAMIASSEQLSLSSACR